MNAENVHIYIMQASHKNGTEASAKKKNCVHTVIAWSWNPRHFVIELQTQIPIFGNYIYTMTPSGGFYRNFGVPVTKYMLYSML